MTRAVSGQLTSGMLPDSSFEALVADVLARARSAPADGVEGVLVPIARFFGADQAHFRRLRGDGVGWDVDHLVVADGAGPALGGAGRPGTSPSTWTERQLLAGLAVHAERVADLPPEAAAERAEYEAQGVVSVLDVALRGHDGAMAACIGLRRRASVGAWTAADVGRLQLVGEVLVGTLALRSLASVQGLDELRRTAALSHLLEERLFGAMDVAALGFFDWDVAVDRVWYMSPFLNRPLHPGDTRETEGSNWFRATHPDDIAAARMQVNLAIDGPAESFDNTVRMKLPYYRGDEWVHIRSRGKVVGRDASGRALRIVGIYEDVSSAVRHAAFEREREAALEHATRSAALGTLATSLAHELNQPLAALTSFVHASVRLLDEGDARRADVKDALRRSAELAEKASEIVRRLRRLAQHAPPQLEAVDLAPTLQSAVELLARDARAAGVEVRLPTGIDGVHVLGDRIQLEQVLVNLVRNAIEASALRESGPRMVTLASRVAGDRAELSVSDTGPGIRADVLSRLFEPFVTTKPSGSGLGLTISRSIVEAHGGAIRVVQSDASGTSFVMTLPVATEDAHEPG
jgi:signal transduction histidine kinase